MTARPIRLSIATTIIAIATALSAGPQLRAAESGGHAGTYSPVAVVELSSDMSTLLAWASHLSGYAVPETRPKIVYRSRAFFTKWVCGGTACKAVGWYNDENVVYLDEKYRFQDQDDFANSLLLHELVHFLQHHSGKFNSVSCNDSLDREREAYAVQNDYLMNVWYSIRFIAPRPTSCAYGFAQQSE